METSFISKVGYCLLLYKGNFADVGVQALPINSPKTIPSSTQINANWTPNKCRT